MVEYVSSTAGELQTRLNRISGQIEGIKKMISDKRETTDVLTQLRAVRAAVKGMETALLTDLLHGKAKKLSAARRDEQIEELVALLRRYG